MFFRDAFSAISGPCLVRKFRNAGSMRAGRAPLIRCSSVFLRGLPFIRVHPCFSVACLYPCSSVFSRGALSVFFRVFPWLVFFRGPWHGIHAPDARSSYPCPTISHMSYTVVLWCGCTVYVSCNPDTGIAHSRIVETRGNACPIRSHERGARLWLWELLPDRRAEGVRVEFT